MKALISIFLLCSLSLQAQEQQLVAMNLETGEVIAFPEKKHIKIKLESGQKIAGKFKIIDTQTIILRKLPIAIKDIVKIKRHPILLSILNSMGWISAGAGVGTAIAFSSDPETPDANGTMALLSGIVVVSVAYFPLNYWSKGYRTSHGWKLKIMNAPDPENTGGKTFLYKSEFLMNDQKYLIDYLP